MWTTPRTWVTGELVTASMMNSDIRDNSNVLYNSGPRMGGAVFSTARAEFTGSGAIADVATVSMGRVPIPDAKAIYDEGFIPQVRVAGRMKNSGTAITRAQASIKEIADDDPAPVEIGTGGLIVTTNVNGAASYQWVDSGWQDVTVTPGTDSDWILFLQVGTSVGTGTYLDMLMGFRWE